ncbi:MAG TPA: hypothetical protein VMX57_04595 [Planctomycetota bacterium]|nr:hypothetical protein [Planctomycetota bacterium]
MSFKNLTSPANNSGVPTKEQVSPIPKMDDIRVNGDPVNTTPDREGHLDWGPPEGERPPMKKLK